MSTGQPDENGPEELDEDAGVNAIRLDADRAREELDKTLSEIERRLDPQRFIQPVKRAVRQTVIAIKTEYQKDPVRFVTVAVITVGAVGLVLTWAGGGIGSTTTPKQATPGLPKDRSTWSDPTSHGSTASKSAKPSKPSQDPVFRNANKVSKRAVAAVVKAKLLGE